MATFAEGVRTRFLKRAAALLAISLALVSIFILLRLHPVPHLKNIQQQLGDLASGKGSSKVKPAGPGLRMCTDDELLEPSLEWEAVRAKYEGLIDNKFTIAIQTYKRPKELDDTLKRLTKENIPSLLEIVVVWNNIDEKPPKNWKADNGVQVRYRASPRNSLNEKLWPDPDYLTEGILLSDDDVYFHTGDLEFAFQTWRNFGRFRLVGAMSRCTSVKGSGSDRHWGYDFCDAPPKSEDDVYSMIITNLAFAHISFLDYYSSDDPLMNQIRDYVDEHFNCEDIAMNNILAMLTRTGPLLVRGRERYHNDEPAEGISRKPGHLEARSQCLNDFADMVGCMPLVNETAKVVRGPHT